TDGRPLFRLQNPSGAVLDIAVMGDDALAIGDRGGAVSVWNLSQRKIMQSHRLPIEGIRLLAFSANDSTLATADRDGYVRLWDLHALP
ncbi:MAG: WD40 repeat domain-containing protein, partial [Candidatus Omnitrophota bacterium]